MVDGVVPQIREVHHLLAKALLHRGKSEEAAVCCQKAIDLGEKTTEVYFDLAIEFGKIGKDEEAVAFFGKARQLSPADPSIPDNFAIFLQRRGRISEAIASNRTTIRLANVRGDWPFLPRAYHNLGVCYRESGRFTLAEASFRKALAIDPTYPHAHFNLSSALREQGKFDEALASMKKGHDLGARRKNWSFPSEKWVKERERLVELDSALPAYRKGEFTPKDHVERCLLADVCRYKGLHALALRLYEEAFEGDVKLEADNRFHAACCVSR